MINQHIHQKIPHFEINSELDMVPTDYQEKSNKKDIVRNETLYFETNSKNVNIHSQNDNSENTLSTKKNSNSKKFFLFILISFIILIIICIAIIFPLIYKNKSKEDDDDISNTDVQSLIDKNKNESFIFETPDYFLVDKISRKQKVYTQGLFFDTNSTVIESGGLYGKSKLRRFDLKNPDNSLYENILESKYFAEGASLYLNKFIFELTWRERVILVYEYDNQDENNVKIKYSHQIELPKQIQEGWGITNENENLIISDGTNILYFLRPNQNFSSLDIINTIQVKKYEEDLSTTTEFKYLNELEYVKNRIFSNVWLTNYILVISPQDGTVMKLIDFSKLLQYEKELNPTDRDIDVLNGIAYDKILLSLVKIGITFI